MKGLYTYEYTPEDLSLLIEKSVETTVRKVLSEILHSIPSSTSLSSSDVLTPTQVCELLKVSRPTLIAYAKNNLLRGRKAGGKIFYKRSDVEKFIAGKQR